MIFISFSIPWLCRLHTETSLRLIVHHQHWHLVLYFLLICQISRKIRKTIFFSSSNKHFDFSFYKTKIFEFSGTSEFIYFIQNSDICFLNRSLFSMWINNSFKVVWVWCEVSCFLRICQSFSISCIYFSF